MKLSQIKGVEINAYPELIYSHKELKDNLKKHYRESKITIEGIARL